MIVCLSPTARRYTRFSWPSAFLLEHCKSVLQGRGDALLNIQVDLVNWRNAMETLGALPIQGADDVTANLAAVSISGNARDRGLANS